MSASDRPAFAALLALLHERKQACGATFRGLETSTEFNRSQIQKAFSSRKLELSVKLARALDKALKADGRIAAAREAAYREQAEARMRADVAVPGGAADWAGDEKETGETNRREALGVLAATAGTLATRIRTGRSGPGRADLFAAQEAVADLSARYGTTRHDELLPEVAQRWRAAEEVLADGWRSDRYRRDFQVVAGQLSFLLSRLAFNLGDYRRTAEFLHLVEAHLEATEDPGLGAATATMWSSLFFYRGNYREALRTAREGHRWRYSYHEAELTPTKLVRSAP